MPASLSARFQPLHAFVGTDAYWLAVGLLAFLTVVPGANSEGYFQTGKLFVLAAVTLLTGTYLWLHRARFRFSAPRPVLWLALGYVAWMTLTNTLLSSQPGTTVLGWPGWRGGLLTNAMYWGLFLLMLHRPKDDHERRPWPLLLGFLALVSLWSTAEFLGLRPWLGNTLLGAVQGDFRVTAFPILTVGNSGWISGLWPLLAPLALVFARTRRWAALLPTLALLLLGVASTQGNLAALVFSGLMVLFAGLTVRRSVPAALLLAACALLPAPVTSGLVDLNAQLRSAGQVTAEQENQFTAQATGQTTSERLLIFTSGLRSAAERPLTGWGYETFHNNFYGHLSAQEREPLLRRIINAAPDEQVGMSGLAVVARPADGSGAPRETTLLMVKPHNYLIEELYSNGFTALLFLVPLLGLLARELLRARTELTLFALLAWLGYGGYLMGWFLNPSVTPLALAILALGLRSADRAKG
ncbi:MAG: O-antigen ligase family protein [Deinococcus sp.]|nr:O-antigen ligase family protein [Deinococcus sp.]